MNTITFNNNVDISFNSGEVIQENDIQNVILAYNYSQSPNTLYTITDISSVFLAETIYEIGINAFINFTSLKGITLCPTINKINIDAFYRCTSLTSIILPDALSFLGDTAFRGCSSLSTVVLNNTSNLNCIGEAIFNDVSANGTYTFGPIDSVETATIKNLICLLPSSWTRYPDIPYIVGIDFAILYDRCIGKKGFQIKTHYVDLSCVPISYIDFHTLFFNNNGFLNLNCNVINQPNVINSSTLANYIVLNKQVDVNGNTFNLMSTLDCLYECSMPQKCWSVESTLYFTKHISKLKTIFNFNTDTNVIICNKEKQLALCEDTSTSCGCKGKQNDSSSCGCKGKGKETKTQTICDLFYNSKNIQKMYIKGPSLITINDFFNMYEALGVTIANDNSYNPIPTLCQAQGLPVNAASTNYIAILNLYVKSMYKSVDNLNIRLPYLINFTASMPKNANDKNNYRYKP